MLAEREFDATRLVLEPGVHLVEASAGTGKTFAIGMLVLRAIVELELPIDRILVVTFTKAATEELRGRIRARLSEARDLLAGQSGLSDQTLRDWRDGLADPDRAGQRLQLALYDIDRAGIFTIHSFCQRMLQEQALESGELFTVDLCASIDEVRQQVVDDFWRNALYNLPPFICSLLPSGLASPERLYGSVSAILLGEGRIEPATAPQAEIVARLVALRRQLGVWWQGHSAKLYCCFSETRAACKFKKDIQDDLDGWWQAIADFLGDDSAPCPEELKYLGREGLLTALHGNKIRGKEKQLNFIADWPLADSLVGAFLAARDELVLALRVDLAGQLRDELPRRLYQQGRMSFDDLIHRLARALTGEGGEALCRLLSARYQMALIDEFQDTDASQWQIFSTLFGGGGHYLYLIGDPKQAIYKFRGADIYSYFAARRRADDRLTLGCNYRSTAPLIAEVNRLFGSRPQPFAFSEELINYTAVRPGKDLGGLLQDDRELPAVVYHRLPACGPEGPWTVATLEDCLGRALVSEVSRLLHQRSPAFFIDSPGDASGQGAGQRPVQPGDIAILVRSNRQAARLQESFLDAGIPAVVASRQSVFTTDEGLELATLLTALASPGDVGLLKTALTISWFGFHGEELEALWQQPVELDGWIGRFQNYHQLWLSHGCLAMINSLLAGEEVYLKLAGQRRGERRIANIIHLLELVQAAESEGGLGCSQTLQWLATMRGGAATVDDAELRLESDEAALRIVTMHGAKGLEYPLVFCPFLWQRSSQLGREKYQISCHDEDYRLVIDLGSPLFAERKAQALAEELAEDLRLLYVAITRAARHCAIYWVGSGDAFNSALGYLLFPEGATDQVGQDAVFIRLATQPGVACRDLDPLAESGPSSIATGPPPGDLVACLPSGRSLHTDWQMTSYSALASLSEHDYVVGQPAPIGEVAGGPILCPGLPAGAHFGNLVHDCLEQHPFADLAGGDLLGASLPGLAHRYGVVADPLLLKRLLVQVVSSPLLGPASPLAGADFCLAELAEDQLIKEMPFTFHLPVGTTEGINRLLAEEPAVTPLSAKSMRGYMTGFIDLFCRHQGRYFILDYKTNYLGDHQDDYGPAALTRAMAAHNYGLQYWLYTLVVHRFLTGLHPDYRYDQHFGGILYLFVRGMDPARPGHGVYAARPDQARLAQLDAYLGGEG